MRTRILLALIVLATWSAPLPSRADQATTAPAAKKAVKKTAKKSKSASAPTTVATPAAVSQDALVPNTWTKEWVAKYVISTKKETYSHVLIDVAPLKDKFTGGSAHAAAAVEAVYLAQSSILDEQAPDLVKCDVVVFEGRDNYGAPLWDSMKRIGHMEFSRKDLAKVSAASITQDESSWKNLFSKVEFY